MAHGSRKKNPAPDHFVVFELVIEKEEQVYRARVSRSPVKDTSSLTIDLSTLDPVGNNRYSLDGETLRGEAVTRHARAGRTDPEDLQEIGRRLYDAVFVGGIREIFDRTLERARGKGKGLRLSLRLDGAPELVALPWEALGDGLHGKIYSGRQDFLVSRSLTVERIREPALAVGARRFRFLGLLPDPRGEEALSGEKEWAKIREIFQDWAAAELLELHKVVPATLEELGRQIDRGPCQILHVVAHGEPGGEEHSAVLLLEKGGGEVDPVGAMELVRALAGQGDNPPLLVVLNTCHGAAAQSFNAFEGLAQKLLQYGVAAVVAMGSAITDAAAREFAKSFYRALARGRTIEGAMAEARRALAVKEHRREWAKPILYLHQESNIRLFDPQRLPEDDGAAVWMGRRGLVVAVALGLLVGLLAVVRFFIPLGPTFVPSPNCPSPPGLPDLQFAEIPAGELALPGDELLQVERAFCMGQTEVTVGQWNAVMGGAPPESEAGLNLPKVRVTPDDARDFAEKLSELDPSGRYRLPSPMEWEYAARAGARTRYFFGASGEDLHEYGNCKNDLGDDGYDELAPVCKFKPNAWGLCDVHGNAAEWVETTGPTQPEKAARRMGGSWMNPEQNCAFGSLLSEVIGNPDYQTGFRLVREIAE